MQINAHDAGNLPLYGHSQETTRRGRGCVVRALFCLNKAHHDLVPEYKSILTVSSSRFISASAASLLDLRSSTLNPTAPFRCVAGTLSSWSCIH